MSSAEEYLRPEVIRNIARLDLRARFIVEGFLSGLHTSPFHGFSVEFSEHRRYNPGDDPRDIDWQVFARTDRFYVRRYQAETNITGYLLMDLSRSMAYTHRQELTKLDYSICLAAAISYLMIHQQDPVGLVTFDEEIRQSVPARSRRSQLGNILAVLQKCRPQGGSGIAQCLQQAASMIRPPQSDEWLCPIVWPIQTRLSRAYGFCDTPGTMLLYFMCWMRQKSASRFSGNVDLLEPESGSRQCRGCRRNQKQLPGGIAGTSRSFSAGMLRHRSRLRGPLTPACRSIKRSLNIFFSVRLDFDVSMSQPFRRRSS